MSTEQNKQSLLRFYAEVFNKGNLDVMDEITTPDFVDHGRANPTRDREGAKQMFQMYRAAFPDLRVTVEDVIAEGDRVATRLRVEGTHQGEMMGVPPTGKKVVVTGIDLLRFENGKAAEHWGEFDDLGMMQQLGLIPEQPS